MQKLPCFIYKEFKHFILPPECKAMQAALCEFAVYDTEGEAHPNAELFIEVNNPDLAHVFLFPFDIGQYIDSGLYELISDLIANLPYLAGREARHLIFDNGDFTKALAQPVCLFKFSVTNAIADRALAIHYSLSPHILAEKAIFNWQELRYDCSFVGLYSNIMRRIAVASLQACSPALRFFVQVDGELIKTEHHFVVPKYDQQNLSARRKIFKKSINESLTVLCLPGVGPQSMRMYESMFLGRIPIIVSSNIVYPFAETINYQDFCLIIKAEELIHTGNILKEWLAQQSPEQLKQKCALACKTWHKYFAPQKRAKLLLAEAKRKFGF